ncbi:DNA internalization-related competence protein ComEC/Rec2 [Carnobacterium jeotgali]|uniref:DNA internalization-related competence protein ComEC/Rec2 n=1 Tax=Carnobacterium jeotgali TaxID=545534 RepID=UPI0022AF8BD9|nr:DNA internalization-related competence protein ComEC/Rec2 [Carnobacterium jeotgali]
MCAIIVLTTHWLSYLLLFIWLIRLAATRRKELIIYTCLLMSATFFFAGFEKNHNRTALLAEDQLFLIELDPNKLKIDGDQIQFYGTVKEAGTKVKLAEKVVVFYRLSTEEEKNNWKKQQKVEDFIVTGSLAKPEKNRNLNQFDYHRYLYRNKIHWIVEATTIDIHSELQQQTFFDKLNLKNLRQNILAHIESETTATIASYIKTLLFADTSSIDDQVMSGYKEIGIIHLLSISGLHIQFFITGLTYILWRLGVTRERTYLLLLIFLPLYGSLTGWGTSIFRAIVMSLLSQTGARIRKPISGLDAWSWTLIFGLWLNPYQIFSIGFQLSYLLSLTLMLFSDSLFNRSKLASINNVVISFILTLISIPILSFHFFEFSWIGMFANLIFVPLFTWVVMPLSIFLFASSYLLSGTLFFHFLSNLMESLLEMTEWLVLKIKLFPYSTIVTGKVPFGLFILMIIGLILFIVALEGRKKIKRSVVLLVVVFTIFIYYQKYNPFGEVLVLDVGQGDAILIKKPFGAGVYLIDTGGAMAFEKEEWQIRKKQSTVASRVLIPVIKSLGVTQIDQVFITHGDEDHMGELKELAESINIKKLIFPVGTTKKQPFYEAAQTLEKNGTKLSALTAENTQKQLFGPSLAVLWPLKAGEGENNDSLVLYGKIGDYYWLFPGDIEEAGEAELAALYPNLRVDILKVAHHGSQTSTSEKFVQQLNPKIALISCGLNNRYNHPNEAVMERFVELNTTVYRTDLQGSFRYTYSDDLTRVKERDFQTILK